MLIDFKLFALAFAITLVPLLRGKSYSANIHKLTRTSGMQYTVMLITGLLISFFCADFLIHLLPLFLSLSFPFCLLSSVCQWYYQRFQRNLLTVYVCLCLLICPPLSFTIAARISMDMAEQIRLNIRQHRLADQLQIFESVFFSFCFCWQKM